MAGNNVHAVLMDAVANETKLSRCRTIRVTNGGGEGEGARGKKRENGVFELGAERARNGEGLRSHTGNCLRGIARRYRRNRTIRSPGGVECGSNVQPDTVSHREDYYARRTERQQRENELRVIASRPGRNPWRIYGVAERRESEGEREKGRRTSPKSERSSARF